VFFLGVPGRPFLFVFSRSVLRWGDLGGKSLAGFLRARIDFPARFWWSTLFVVTVSTLPSKFCCLSLISGTRRSFQTPPLSRPLPWSSLPFRKLLPSPDGSENVAFCHADPNCLVSHQHHFPRQRVVILLCLHPPPPLRPWHLHQQRRPLPPLPYPPRPGNEITMPRPSISPITVSSPHPPPPLTPFASRLRYVLTRSIDHSPPPH